MHNKIIKIFKQISFITSHPDADWLKIFFISTALFVYMLTYNIFLYLDTQSSIDSLGSSSLVKKIQPQAATKKDDELSRTIKAFDEKLKKNTELRNSKAPNFPDPIY